MDYLWQLKLIHIFKYSAAYLLFRLMLTLQVSAIISLTCSNIRVPLFTLFVALKWPECVYLKIGDVTWKRRIYIIAQDLLSTIKNLFFSLKFLFSISSLMNFPPSWSAHYSWLICTNYLNIKNVWIKFALFNVKAQFELNFIWNGIKP